MGGSHSSRIMHRTLVLCDGAARIITKHTYKCKTCVWALWWISFPSMCFSNAPNQLPNHNIHRDINLNLLCLRIMCSRKSSRIRDIFHTGDSSETTFLIFKSLPFLTFLILVGEVGRIFFLSQRVICFFLLMHFSNVAFNFYILWEKFLADVALKLDCFTNLDFFAVCFFLGQELSWSGFNPSPPLGPLLYQHDGFLSHMSSLRARVTSLKSCAAAVLRLFIIRTQLLGLRPYRQLNPTIFIICRWATAG